MRYRVSLDQFQRIVAHLGPELNRAMITGLRSGAARLAGLVVEEIDAAEPHPAVDRGELRGSVQVERVDDGAIVEVRAPHAAIIEYGTRPFFPPIAPLAAWARRKGFTDPEGAAFAIALAISRRGIAPRGYFAKAVARGKRWVRIEVDRELAALGRRLPRLG